MEGGQGGVLGGGLVVVLPVELGSALGAAVDIAFFFLLVWVLVLVWVQAVGREVKSGGGNLCRRLLFEKKRIQLVAMMMRLIMRVLYVSEAELMYPNTRYMRMGAGSRREL